MSFRRILVRWLGLPKSLRSHWLLWTILVSIFHCPVTQAAKPHPPGNPMIDAEIELTRPDSIPSEIYRLEKRVEKTAEATSETFLKIEISSGAPQQFSLPSQIQASPLSPLTLPQVTFSFARPLTFNTLQNTKILGKLGLQFQPLTRSGVMGAGAISSEAHETLYAAGIQAGLNWYPQKIQSRKWMPYLGASLIPTFILSSPSVFDSGISQFTLPIALELGSDLDLFSTAKNQNFPIFNLGLVSQLGIIQNQSYHSLGLLAGIRIPL